MTSAVYKLRYRLEDSLTRQTTKTFKTNAVDFAGLSAANVAMTVTLNALTKSAIRIGTLEGDFSGADSPTAGSNNDVGLVLVFKSDDANDANVSVRVPSPIDGLTLPNGEVDITNAAIVNFSDDLIQYVVLNAGANGTYQLHTAYIERP
jgi:hypothetical protein